jgi:hypothetical protein
MTNHLPSSESAAAAASRHRSRGHLARGLLTGLMLCAGLSSCRILADEFVMLDRAAPAAMRTPDAPRGDLADRP